MTFQPNYVRQSPYYLTNLTNRFLGYYVHRRILAHPLDIEYTIIDQRYVERPDILAYDFLGDWQLWWVIPVRNNLEDPMFDLTYGRNLIIPNIEYVRSIV